jgi:hypothetical protein
MKPEEREAIASALEQVADRLDTLNANLEITNRTVREVAQVSALVQDMVRELHARQIELADDHGAKIRQLEMRVGTNGRG